ncbi:MAG TPA: hypothetical protein VEL47_05000 [Myxococcota bacterium]|nr:hypothetical protein [Myxococcota bacterium]
MNNSVYSAIFVSQNDQDYYPGVNCGVAALLTLLKSINYEPLPKFKELADALRRMSLPTQKGYYNIDIPMAIFPEDIMRYCVKSNFHFRMHFFDDEWKECLKIAPIMVLVTGDLEDFGPDGHWIVLVERNKDFFTYLDPWLKSNESYIKHISSIEFKKFYSGIALQLFPT